MSTKNIRRLVRNLILESEKERMLMEAPEDEDTEEDVPVEEEVDEAKEETERLQQGASDVEDALMKLLKTMSDFLEEDPELKERFQNAKGDYSSSQSDMLGILVKIIKFCEDNKDKKPEIAEKIIGTTIENQEVMTRVQELGVQIIKQHESMEDSKEKVESLIALYDEIASSMNKAFEFIKSNPDKAIEPKKLVEGLETMVATNKVLLAI